MKHDEAIIKILGKTVLEIPDIDQNILRNILEETLYAYSIELSETSLAVRYNMPEYISIYLSSKQLDGLSPLTLKNYRYILIDFSNTICKDINEITTMDIRAYLVITMRDRNISAVTANSYRSMIKSFFSWLTDEEMIQKDPSHKLRPSKLPKRERIALDDSELEILIDSCVTLRERAFIELASNTGCRVAELSNMNTSDINWNDRSIQVIGKGNKQRTVYFSGRVGVHLRKYLGQRMFSNSPIWITSKLPHNRMSTRSLEREVEGIKKRTNIAKPVHPHILRHTFGTHAIKSGMSIQSIQVLMGHSSVATTQIYAKIDKDSLKNEHRKYMS